MRNPLLIKILALVVVITGLSWGLSSVSGVVDERAGRLREAERSVANSLASAQTILGPVITRYCAETWPVWQGEGKDAKQGSERREFSVEALPRKLVVDGRATIDPRYRGIYKVNAFNLNADLAAEWGDLSPLDAKPLHAGGVIACGAPILMLAMGDTRGVLNAELRVQDQPVAVAPGTLHRAHARGLHAILPDTVLQAGSSGHGSLRAKLRLGLVGTQSLAFVPMADDNDIKLTSDWPHPSFGGRFLPGARRVDDHGFSARWQISSLATTARDGFLGGQATCRYGEVQSDDAGSADPSQGKQPGGAPCMETFGLSFADPVNPYVLSDRATKYGLLFIVLTFVAVGLVEVTRRLRVHPIQYLLVGSALVVFFLLLVSLSEQWPFAWAYATAAAASASLLAYYGIHVLRGLRAGLAFGAGMVALFGVLYVLLQLEQGSLVLGSVLLFAVLSAVMVVTRRLDWYGLFDQWRVERESQSRTRSTEVPGNCVPDPDSYPGSAVGG